MKKIIIMLISLIVFLPSVVADVVIEPETIQLDLTAGDTITKTLNITSDESIPIIVFLASNVTNGEGIEVSYAPSTILLYPNKPKIIIMTIDTAINLAPGEYNVTTKVYKEVESYFENQTKNATKNLTECKEQFEKLLETLNVTEAELENITSANQDLLDIIDDLLDLIDELKDIIKEMEPIDEETDKKDEKGFDWSLFLIISGIIVIIIAILVYLFIRYKQNRKVTKGEGEKGSTGPKNK